MNNLPSPIHPALVCTGRGERSGSLARWLRVAPSLAVLALALGCATEPPPEHAFETTKYTLENTDKFTVIADPTAPPVACTGLQQHALADGRLEVIANLKNRDHRAVEVQASCAFSVPLPGAIVSETPWQNVTLPEDATQTVRFVAPNASATRYSVRVRAAR